MSVCGEGDSETDSVADGADRHSSCHSTLATQTYLCLSIDSSRIEGIDLLRFVGLFTSWKLIDICGMRIVIVAAPCGCVDVANVATMSALC